jgi:CTP:molybdopterin cytidylyltransferase MocA
MREGALARLKRVKDGFSASIATRYAHRAKDCSTCPAPCCGDAEFVNVNITRLEGEATLRTLADSPRVTPEHRARIVARARETVRRYELDRAVDTFATT